MRFLTKFLLFLATVYFGLKYACESPLRAQYPQLQLACHYSQPALWNDYLLKNSPAYKNSVHPQLVVAKGKYEELVQPHVKDVCKRVHTQLDRIDKKKYCDLAHSYANLAYQKAQFYYSISAGKYVHDFCKSDLYNKNLKRHVERAKEDLSKAYHLAVVRIPQLFTRENVEKFTSSASAYINEKTESLKKEAKQITSDVKKTVESEIKKRTTSSESEEEPIVSTSTIVKTITRTRHSSSSTTSTKSAEETSEKNLETKEEEDITDIEIDHQAQLQRDFDKWTSNIDKKVKMVNKMLVRDVKKQLKPKIDANDKLFKDKLKVLHKEANDNFQLINKAIQDINCTQGVDPETGKQIYFDSEGKSQIEKYITREMIRTMLNDTQTTLNSLVADIENDVSKILEDFKKIAENSREQHLTTFEEWGDIMINEWSKKLAYLDVLAPHEDAEHEGKSKTELSEKNWKKFMAIKKQILDARDKMAKRQIKISEFKLLLDNVQNTLQAVTNENGEYLYILRAQANLAFQERERLEKEAEEAKLRKEAGEVNESSEEEQIVEEPISA